MVPILSSSEKPMASGISTLALFESWLMSLKDRWATDITLDSQDPVLPGAAKMTLIVPKKGLEGTSLRDLELAWLPWPLEWYRSCFNLPSRTSWSKWSHRLLQSSVVCSWSWWYWQWRLWLRFSGFPIILFGPLKNGSFLIFSNTWCTGSRNTALTTWVLVDFVSPA